MAIYQSCGYELRTEKKNLKNNSKKSKSTPKTVKTKKQFECIHYLGFVVDTELTGPKALTHALINLSEKHDDWYLINLDIQSSSENKDSVGRYFRTVFCVAVNTWLLYKSQGTLFKGAVVVEKTERQFSKIGSDLRNWAREDKVKMAFEEFPMLRMAVHDSLFAASGAHKKPLNVIWKGNTTPEAIFFWPPQKFHEMCSQAHPDQVCQIIKLESLPPVTELSPESLISLINILMHKEHTNSWQELYCCYAMDHRYAPSPQWLDIGSLEVDNSKKELLKLQGLMAESNTVPSILKFKSTPLPFPKIVEQYKNVLLTGPAGAGKTTAFKLLKTSWMSHNKPLEEPQIAFYIKLKDIAPFLEKTVVRNRNADLSELIGQCVVAVLRANCSGDELEKCQPKKRLLGKTANTKHWQPDREAMLSSISEEVVTWFKNIGKASSTTLVLLDGTNELLPRYRAILKTEIEALSNCNCHIVFSCRSNLADRLFLNFNHQFMHFELQKLESEQIVEYLNHNFQGQGKQIYDSQLRNKPHLFSMARNPFNLSLIVAKLKTNTNIPLPQYRVDLISDFIHDTIECRLIEGISVATGILDDTVFAVLKQVALWSINSFTQASWNNEYLPFTTSSEFKSIQASSNEIFQTLELAEIYGLLEFSGLAQESRERCGYPSFIHNNIRDYFAAMSFSERAGLSEYPNLREMLEFREWDGIIEMYFNLLKDRRRFRDDLHTIAEIDPFLASRCLLWSRISNESDAKHLFSVFFPLERISKLDMDSCEETDYSIKGALARIYSFHNDEFLEFLLFHPIFRDCVKAAIPSALVMAHRDDAVQYFKRMCDEHGSACKEYVSLGMWHAGTIDAWEWLCEEYIQLASLKDPSCDTLETFISDQKFQPTPDMVWEFIQKAEMVLGRSNNNYIAGRVIETLTSRLENAGKTDVNLLCTIKQAGTDGVAQAATRGLVYLKHEKTIHELFDSVCHTIENTPSVPYMHDLKALCSVNTAELDFGLWELYERIITHNKATFQAFVIPAVLSSRTDADKLGKMITLAFKYENHLAAMSLRSFMDMVPMAVCEVARNIVARTEKNSFLWCRAVTALGYCGDNEVAGILSEMLLDFMNIRWSYHKGEISDETLDELLDSGIDHTYRSFFLKAIKKFGTRDHLTTLLNLLNTCKDTQTLISLSQTITFLYNSSIQTPEEMYHLVANIASTCRDTESPVDRYKEISECQPYWSNAMLQCLFEGLRDKIDEMIKNEPVDCNISLLYILLCWLRDDLPNRFLDIFHEWPSLPYEHRLTCKQCKKSFPEVQFVLILACKEGLCSECLFATQVSKDLSEIWGKTISSKVNSYRSCCAYCKKCLSEDILLNDNLEICADCLSKILFRIRQLNLLASASIKKIEYFLQSNNPFCMIAAMIAVQENSQTYSSNIIRPIVISLGEEGNFSLWIRVRQTAIETLQKLGHSSIKYCLESISSKNWRIRANIAMVIAFFRDSKITRQILMQLSNDSDKNVRDKVIVALECRTDPTARKIILRLSTDDNSEVALKASQIKEKNGFC